MAEQQSVAILGPVTVRCGFCRTSEEIPREPAERVTRLRARLAQIRWAQGAEEGPAIALTRTLEWWRSHSLPMVGAMFALACFAGLMQLAHAFELPPAMRVSAIISALAVPFASGATLGGVTVGFLWSMREYVREVRPAVEARAPRALGSPMRCRACGGDLPAGGSAGFVRCSYCAAENLVTDAIAKERETRLDRELREQQARAQGMQVRMRDASARYTKRLYLAMAVGAGVSLAISMGVGAIASIAARMLG